MITEKLQHLKFRHVVEPYDHQRAWFEKTRSWEFYAFFWEMGTGKTKPLLDTAAWLFLTGEIDGLLVVSDKGSYLNWPMVEVPRHLQSEIPTRQYSWRSSDRYTNDKILTAQDDVLDIVYVNVEALSSMRAYEWCRSFLNNHYAMMVVDESTSIKNPKAARARSCHSLGTLAEYRRIATGTPVTQNPLDVYSQTEFLKPGVLGHSSYTAFKYRYAIMREMRMGTRRFMTVAGYVNQDELKIRLADISSRITKAECLDLPDKVYEQRFIELTEAQSKIYRQLKDEAVVLLQNGMLSSTSALTTVEKLHQICCGHVKDDDGITHDIDNNRLDTLVEMVEDLPGKIIIWAYYQRDVELVYQALREHGLRHGDFPVHYYGKTTPEDRVQAIHNFCTNESCKWFVGSPSTGGKGITLTVSSTVIYYSCGFNLEHRLQSEDRAHRIGQVNKVTYIDFVCPNTIETRVLKALKSKQDLAHALLDADRLREFLSDDPA